MKYPEGNITVLTDEEENLTKEQVICELKKIAAKTKNREKWKSAIITFSGHGSSKEELETNQEEDGRDELLICSDGYISDNQLHDLLGEFDSNCHVLFSIDTCHSGTMLDLKYSWRSFWDEKTETFKLKKARNDKYTDVAARVVMISGCRDDQTSADALLKVEVRKSYSWRMQGAYTNALLKLLRLTNTQRRLLDLPGELAATLCERFRQRPVLSSSFDIPGYLQLFDW